MNRQGTASGQSVTDALCKFALSQIEPSQIGSNNSNSHFGATSDLPGRGRLSQTVNSNDQKCLNENGTNESDKDIVSNVCDRDFDTDLEDCGRLFRRNSDDRNSIPFINDVSDERSKEKVFYGGGQVGHVSGSSFDELCRRTFQECAVLHQNIDQPDGKNDAITENHSEWSLSNPYVASCLSGLSSGESVESQLWQAVRDNPFNFDGWTKLIQYVEGNGSLEEGRSVFNSFLPLYPYCYVYWKKYADIEFNAGNIERACQILEKGVMSIPLSVDLWMAYINMYHQYMIDNDEDIMNVRLIGQRALKAAGSQFIADVLWECVIQLEMTHGDPESVLKVYRQLMSVPTRAHTKHWSAVLQLVHGYHPKRVVSTGEYLDKQKEYCIEMNVPFKEEPEMSKSEKFRATNSDSTMVNAIRDKIIQELTRVHESTERKIKKISKLEDKIKRPYFHVIPLEKRQIRAWWEYLELETSDSTDPRQIVLLYERCLVPCAQYEEFWVSYTRYLESKLDKSDLVDVVARTGYDSKKHDSSISACAIKNNGIIDNRGDQAVVTGINDDGNRESCTDEPSDADNAIKKITATEASLSTNVESAVKLTDGESNRNSSENVRRPFVPASSDELLWNECWPGGLCRAETVRAVYRRACLVHCANKPNIRLQWALFEEQTGCLQAAREILATVIESYSQAVRPRLQLIALERRHGSLQCCSLQYELATTSAQQQTLRSWWAMKHARFCFKIMNKPDKALGVLRSALKSDRANQRLYDYILDICYQRRPVDIRGVGAVLTLALNNKDLSEQQRVVFMRKRVEFYEEFGSLQQLRMAEDSLSQALVKIRSEEKAAKKRNETEAAAGNVKAGKRKRKAEKSALDGGGDCEISDTTKATAQLCPRCGWNVSDPYSSVQVQAIPVPTNQQFGLSLSFPDSISLQNSYTNFSAKREMNSVKRSKNDSDQTAEAVPVLQPAMVYPSSYTGSLQFPTTVSTFVGPMMPQQPMSVQMVPSQLPRQQTPDQQPVSDVSETGEPERGTVTAVSTSPCVNVPDWFVRVGGDLRISESEEGWSLLRLWPNFLSDTGRRRLFDSLRENVKWQRKQQPTPNGKTAPLQRLVAWFGASEYGRDGCTLAANCNWPPALLDLLHRLSDLNDLDLNSCALSLFRDGRDCHPWHWERHEALGPAPTLVLISLGARRLIEFRRRSSGHLLRFPLVPGSLLVMEGRLQSDWLHQLPSEPACSRERISLEFRTMYD